MALAISTGASLGLESEPAPSSARGTVPFDSPLLDRLLQELKLGGYRHTTVTPETHALVQARGGRARSIDDVFGWNQPFEPETLGEPLFGVAKAAGACARTERGDWRATLRVSSLGDELFVHSAYPTLDNDAVFFGPDSYRFVRAVLAAAGPATRAVDLGCGSGVGGICLAKLDLSAKPVVLADISERALQAARTNARLADARVEVVKSDMLSGVSNDVDLVIANPPYLRDSAKRLYRHGGGEHGEGLSLRIVREALGRMARQSRGGTLLLYTGAAIVAGQDTLLRKLQHELRQLEARYEYDELDPDVFSSELTRPEYADVQRLAVVFLQAWVRGRGSR